MRKRAAKLYTKKQQEDNSAAQQVRMFECVKMGACACVIASLYEAHFMNVLHC
jgi:hypothetical protein